MDKPTTYGAISLLLFATNGALAVIDFKSAPLSVALLFVAFASLLYATALWFQKPRIALYWRWDWPWWGLVPLNLAAEFSFKRLRGTDWERLALDYPTPEERLNHMARYLAKEAREIYGRVPPGDLRPISAATTRVAFIRGGGTSLHMLGNSPALCEDLHIHRTDLWRAIKSMKCQSAL